MSEYQPTEPSLKPKSNLIIPKEAKHPEKNIPKIRFEPDPNLITTIKPKPEEKIIPKIKLEPDPNFRPSE